MGGKKPLEFHENPRVSLVVQGLELGFPSSGGLMLVMQCIIQEACGDSQVCCPIPWCSDLRSCPAHLGEQSSFYR